MPFRSTCIPVLFRLILFGPCLIAFMNCTAQLEKSNNDVTVGGPCEGCEALFEYGDRALSSVAVLPGYDTAHAKLHLQGTVYHADGRKPAEGIILYFHHTNAAGIYAAGPNPTGWGRRHGMFRGWVKTDSDGKYEIRTQVPAPYPGRSEPAHIHITVKEPGMTPYYVESVQFDEDPLLDYHHRNTTENRGGSGIVVLEQKRDIYHAARDIYLGRNIPGYPK